MTTATYRGVKYNVEGRKLNFLQIIKDQIQKEMRLKAAQIASINWYLEGIDPPFFIDIICYGRFLMERRQLKDILHKLKEVVEELEVEIYADTDTYMSGPSYRSGDDDDGYADWQAVMPVLWYDHIDSKHNASIWCKKAN